MMQLQINGDPEQVVWLRRPNYLIGQSNMCNLRFRDAELESVHAHLKVDEGGVTLAGHEDALVEVNGQRVESETRLKHGDRVALGKLNLAVMDPEHQEQPRHHKHPRHQEHREHREHQEHPADARGGNPEAPESQRSAGTESDRPPEETASAASWVLHGLSSGLAGKRYTIDGSTVFGRGQACDVRLAEAHLSRCHARLVVEGDNLLVEDLESANGTFVNGRRIRYARLKNGDELSLDTVKFRIIHVAVEEDDDATMLHGLEGKQKPSRPAGPTAIDIQRANLRRMRDDTQGHTAVMSRTHHPGPKAPAGGWLAVTVIVVLAGAVWGAKSFLGVPFPG